ncbi:MAG: hypothetical protein IPM89_01070 [Candidatus Competibacteraceae bacterium]|nr:MAG: hypothetical protein IPM89_01070 [Candidatus Competibacteraceae bacterium]
MMQSRWHWIGLGIVLGLSHWPAWSADPDPEAVRRLMEKYRREAEAEKHPPAHKSTAKPAPKPTPKKPTVNYDREAWKSAENCGTAACFEAYLADYPKGQYARMARARLKSEPIPQTSKITTVPVASPAVEQVIERPLSWPMTVTVVEFAMRGGLIEQAGAIIADVMMSAIANTGRFTLKDRLPLSAAAKIAKAQEFGSTGLLDPKTAAELGRLYGVDAVVTGGVYKLGDLITVTARLIDTKTASLLRSGQIQGKDIDTILFKMSELVTMIMVPPEPPAK